MTQDAKEIIKTLQDGDMPEGYKKVYIHPCETKETKGSEKTTIFESAFYSIVSSVCFRENGIAWFGGISMTHFYVYAHQDHVDAIERLFDMDFPMAKYSFDSTKYYLDPKFKKLEALVTLLFINDYSVNKKFEHWDEELSFPVIGRDHKETNCMVIAEALYDLGLGVD